ncbi:vomeronasal type-1 receptor 4-like [Bos javanicus]|nr:vomeronasal type-1 receptor 4-like [Bos javanicus]
MAAGDLTAGFILLLQTVFGMLGNFFLLYHYLFLYCTGIRLKTIDFIVKNLIVANILVLLSCGFHNVMANFQWHNLNRDFACRFFPYVRVVGRGVSIGTTCLLSVFQVITISPRNSRWGGLKVKVLKCVVPSVILCWIVNMVVNVIYLMYLSGDLSNKSITNRKRFGHCSAVRHDQTRDSLYAVLMSFPDVLCFVVMIWASGSTVLILYRHKQRVQNIHSIKVSSISSPESRATKTILLVVSTFVNFNTLSTICNIVLSLLNNPSLFFVNSSAIVTACFPTISPFLLMSRDSRISRLCFAEKRNTNSPTPRKKM